MVTKETEASARGSASSAQWAFFAAVLLIFIGARLWRLTTSCLWFDEIFSIHAARYGWAEMLKFVAADFVHPPLFYAVLKVWILIGGESLVWLRLFSVFFSVAALVPFWFLCRELNLKPAERNLALLLMAVSHYLINYAQEIRMYGPVFFLSVTSLWLFVRFMKGQTSRWKSLIALSAINLLLVYTHYFGWALVAVELFVVLIYRRDAFRRFILAVIGLALAYVPWIYALLAMRPQGQGVSNLVWFPRPGFQLLKLHFVLLNEPFLFSEPGVSHWLSEWLTLLLIGIPLIVFCYQLFRGKPRRHQDEWLLLFAFAPLIGAVAISWILPFPIWGSRHLMISAAPYFIIVALAIVRLRPYWVKVAVSLLLGCWIILTAGVTTLTPAPKFTWCSWESLVQQTPSDDSPTAIYAFEDLIAYHLWFAATQTNRNFTVTSIKNIPGILEDRAFFLPRRFNEVRVGQQSAIEGEHIWLAFRARRWDEAAPPLSIVRQQGYQMERVLSIRAQGEHSFLVELRRGP
jgi:hypothetical protein